MVEYLIDSDGSKLKATATHKHQIDELIITVNFYDGTDKFRVQLVTSTNEYSTCESGRWPFQMILSDGRIIGCDPDAWVNEQQRAYVPYLRTYAKTLS